MNRKVPNNKNTINKETKSNLFFAIVKFILGIIFTLTIDMGAMLWLVTLVTEYRYFNYALLILVCVAVVVITLLYFCSSRASEIFQGFPKIVSFFYILSFILFIIFIYLLRSISIQAIGDGLPYQAKLSHCAYRIFSECFGNRQGESLEAINETISYDDKNAMYYLERGKLLIEIYDKMTVETVVVSITDKQISFTEEDCLKNAISDYTTAILLESDKTEYIFTRGKAYAKMGDDYSDEALADLKEAVEKEGDNPDYCFEYAKELIDIGDGSPEQHQAAKKYLDKAVNLATGDNEAEYYRYYAKALQNIEEEEFRSKGLSAYIKSISISDQDETNIMTTELGNYLTDHKELIDDIIENLKKELDRDNFNANLWYEYGYLLRIAGRYDEALKCLNEVIDSNPLYFDAYVQRSLVNNKLENYKKSVNDISIMLHHKDILEYHIYRADYYYNDDNYKEAIEDYMLAANKGSSKSAYCYYSCGQSYYRLEDYANAAFYYDKAISEGLSDNYKASCYQECGDVYYYLGNKEYQNENAELGNEYYKTAIERYNESLNWENSDNERAYCYYSCGLSYYELEDYTNAAFYYDKAISEGLPDSYEASCYQECGNMYYCLGNKEYQNENAELGNEYYKTAIERYNESLNWENSDNERTYCYYLCGQLYYKFEDYANAAFYYDKAISEGLPDSYEASCYQECGNAYYSLGSIEYQNKNAELGNEYYKTAIERYYEALNWENSDNKRAYCYYWAGNAHSTLGDYKSALSDYEAACEYSDETDYRAALNRCKEH